MVHLGKELTRGINSILDWVLVISLFAIGILVLSQAVLRYALKQMPLGLENMALLIASWVYFIGMALACRNRKQMVVNIVNLLKIPRRVLLTLDIIAGILTVLVALAFNYMVIHYCIVIYNRNLLISPFGISQLYQALSLVVGLTLITIYESIGLYRIIRR